MSETCAGCGLELRPVDTPTHAYIGASPSCWSLYGELLAREYTDWDPDAHRLSADTYAVQHPGGDDRRAAVGGISPDRVASRARAGFRERRTVTAAIEEFPRLESPRPNGTLTVRDVLDGTSVEDWARDVWHAWALHHERARGWACS